MTATCFDPFADLKACAKANAAALINDSNRDLAHTIEQAAYIARLELALAAKRAKLRTKSAELAKLKALDETGEIPDDCMYSHEFNGIEYTTSTFDPQDEDAEELRIFIAGREVTRIVSDSFKRVADSAHHAAIAAQVSRYFSRRAA